MAYWSGDNNNPNRDLSDPSWVSVEGARAMRARYRPNRSIIETKKECKHEKIICANCHKEIKK